MQLRGLSTNIWSHSGFLLLEYLDMVGKRENEREFRGFGRFIFGTVSIE